MEKEKDLKEEEVDKREDRVEDDTSKNQSSRETKDKAGLHNLEPAPQPEGQGPSPTTPQSDSKEEKHNPAISSDDLSASAESLTESSAEDTAPATPAASQPEQSKTPANPHDEDNKSGIHTPEIDEAFEQPPGGADVKVEATEPLAAEPGQEGIAQPAPEGINEEESEATIQDEHNEDITPKDEPADVDEIREAIQIQESSGSSEQGQGSYPETAGTAGEMSSDDTDMSGQKQQPQVEPVKEDADESGVVSEPISGEEVKNPVESKAEEETNRKKGKDYHQVELHTEEDLAEKAHESDGHEDEDHEDEDYSQYNKEQLVDLIKILGKSENVLKSERVAKTIKPYFDEIKDKERQEALDRFVKEGGEEEDFEFKNDELTDRFDANWKLIRDKKSNYLRELEQRKEANLKKKEEILESLREFVDADDPNISFNTFKEIQNEWKHVGPVPGAHSKTLWANYNALVNRFYDNRSIYFELKELDRRKNLESKLELCERAEKLSGVEILQDAIKELNELHHEFKHIGPVPKEEQEPLWQRFKAASDAVYARRKEHVEQFKLELKDNLEIKTKLAEEVQVFTRFDSDRIKQWNAKTKEILELQKRWEAVGSLPRARAKELNKKFWSAFKSFFHNKGAFFKKLDAQREDNLKKKQVLLEQAITLKDNTDWEATANALKQLQKDWKEIGPVPEKVREKIYKEFKDACDFFFEHMRASGGGAEKGYIENLKKKQAICEEIEQMTQDKISDLDRLSELQESFGAIGFVPKRDIGSIKNRFNKAVKDYVESIEDLTDEEKEQVRMETQVMKLKSEPYGDQKLHRKEMALQKQIAQIENDIAVWKNNMEFFASSKKADKLKDEFNDKIEEASEHLKNLKSQLRMIRSV